MKKQTDREAKTSKEWVSTWLEPDFKTIIKDFSEWKKQGVDFNKDLITKDKFRALYNVNGGVSIFGK